MIKQWQIIWGSEPIETEEGCMFEIYCSDGHVRVVFIDPYNWHPYEPLDPILLSVEEEYIPNWKTKEGEEMKVSEMTDRHYHNAIAFVQRRIVTYPSTDKKHQVSSFWLAVLKTDPRFSNSQQPVTTEQMRFLEGI